MKLLLITRFTMQEAMRKRLFLAVLILCLVVVITYSILLHVAIGSLDLDRSSVSSQIVILGAGILVTVLVTWLVYLLSSLLTIVLTAGSISGEIEAGTFSVIIPKPLRRIDIVLGKWLGNVIILGLFTAVLFLSFQCVTYIQTGYWPEQVLNALGTLELGMMVLVGITTLGSACVPTIVNGAIALILFISAPLVGFVQFIVTAVNNNTPNASMQNIATIVNLIVPTDALWHGTSYFLLPSPELFSTLGRSVQTFNSPFTSVTPIAPALVIWAVCYSLVLPALAALRFRYRDF
jgi:ABC-type transport system involved in multi-copper enzyme maturation permease subunit